MFKVLKFALLSVRQAKTMSISLLEAMEVLTANY